jgi:hypothetical protein
MAAELRQGKTQTGEIQWFGKMAARTLKAADFEA